VIARRVVIDHVRRRACRPQSVTSDDWQELADAAQPASNGFTELVELEFLLSMLSTDRREALILTQVLGLSYAETAEICDCPIGTIRSRVARAREELVALAADERGGGRAATR
jgi:RNA polymerase sigma-70 factor (ECF subfamily)